MTKRYAPLLLVAYFAFCSTIGITWGILVKTPTYPPMSAVPVYPNAQAIIDRTARPPGLASPTPFVPGSTTSQLIDFEFTTSDTPEIVLQFYRDLLQNEYGYKLWRVDNDGAGGTVLNFVRDTHLRDRELIRVGVTPARNGLTRVEATMQVVPAQLVGR
jgi:hypothetical protein